LSFGVVDWGLFQDLPHVPRRNLPRCHRFGRIGRGDRRHRFVAVLTPGKYQVTATRGKDEVLRQGFDDPASANEAFREALVRYPDCEVKLIEAGVVLISAGPAPPLAGR
jgi:hypothetical protein